MKAAQIIESRLTPHPDLHVVVELRIYYKKKEPWAEYDVATHPAGHYADVEITIPVPDHINFEAIKDWLNNRGIGGGMGIFWDAFAAQQPEKAKAGIIVKGMAGYVHKDGTPYDTQPLQKGRLDRVLGDSLARMQIDKLITEDEERWLEVDAFLHLDDTTDTSDRPGARTEIVPLKIKIGDNFGWKELRELEKISAKSEWFSCELEFQEPVLDLVYQAAIEKMYAIKPTGYKLWCYAFSARNPRVINKDGQPIDLTPMARQHIDTLLGEDEPEDRLYAKLKFKVNVWHNPDKLTPTGASGNLETSVEFTVVVDVSYAEFDVIRFPLWWEGFGCDRIEVALSQEYPKEWAAIKVAADDHMIDVSYEVLEVSFVDYFLNPIDTNSIEFNRKRTGAALGEDERPHPGLCARCEVEISIWMPNGELPVNLEKSDWTTTIIIPILDDTPWSVCRTMDAGGIFTGSGTTVAGCHDTDIYKLLFQNKQGKLATDIEKSRRIAEGEEGELKVEAEVIWSVLDILGWCHEDGSPYDTQGLEIGHVDGLLGKMTEAHEPHPDLHVVIYVHVSSWATKNERWREVKLRLPIPDSVPFEKIHNWVFNERWGPQANEIWDAVQEQAPNVAKNVILKGEDIFFDKEEILAYVHKDGTPYDTQPLQKDRLSRLLGD